MSAIKNKSKKKNSSENFCRFPIIKEQIKNHHEKKGTSLSTHVEYVCFGILISMFSFGKCFITENSCLSKIVFAFTIISLFLIYFFKFHILKKTRCILMKYKEDFSSHKCDPHHCEKIEEDYKSFSLFSYNVFLLFQIMTFLSSVFFIFLAYAYFFY